MKEIERKFILKNARDIKMLLQELNRYKLIQNANILQAYISSNIPEVRIRACKSLIGKTSYFKMDIKSDGDVVRDEITFDIDNKKFDKLLSMIKSKPITKRYMAWRLPDGHVFEFSIVDSGKFAYAEIEFNGIDDLNSYELPEEIDKYLKDVSFLREYSMRNYWESTRVKGQSEEYFMWLTASK